MRPVRTQQKEQQTRKTIKKRATQTITIPGEDCTTFTPKLQVDWHAPYDRHTTCCGSGLDRTQKYKNQNKNNKKYTKQNVQDNFNEDQRDKKEMRRQITLSEFHFKANHPEEDKEKENQENNQMTKRKKRRQTWLQDQQDINKAPEKKNLAWGAFSKIHPDEATF